GDLCVCYRDRGGAAPSPPLLACNGHNDSSRLVLSPTRAKASDQGDRQARWTERSSGSSTRTENGSKRQAGPPLSAIPKMIDILSNSFTCDAVPGLSPALRDRTLIPARLIQTEQILWRKNRSKRRSKTSSSSNSASTPSRSRRRHLLLKIWGQTRWISSNS